MLRNRTTVTTTTPKLPLGDAGRDATAELLGANTEVVLGVEFDGIVRTTFALTAASVEADYMLVELAIQPLGHNRNSAMLTDALDKAHVAARTSHRLLVNAALVFEKVKTEIESAQGALREAAKKNLLAADDEQLGAEPIVDEGDGAETSKKKTKAAAPRRKSITNDDVTAEMHRLYPKDMAAYRERLAKAKGTVDHLEWMTDIVKSRIRSLEVMLSRA